MRRAALAVLLAALTVLAIPIPAETSSGEDADRLLLDWGNGEYAWYDMSSGDTLLSAVSATLDAASVDYVTDGTCFTEVGGVGERTVGTQTCSWRIYIWDTYQWIYGEKKADESYNSGTLALAYYPSSSILPVPTPFFNDSWTSYRGNSSNSGMSASQGPEKAATPLEWYLEADTGGVYSSILAADGLLYYVTGGNNAGSGANRSPHLYCVDTVNHGVAWSFSYTISTARGSQQYEIDTPVIIGDMIVITSSNRHIYCLDRMEGTVLSEMVPEGEKAHFAGQFDTYTYTYETTTPSGTVYANGPTSAVYDSGALYFNTHDGAMHCYSVTRESGFTQLWRCLPEESERGCFYFSSPTIAYCGGERVVLSGGYSGYLYMVDADTGELLGSSMIGDLGELGAGAVSIIRSAGDGKAVVMVDDGGMSVRTGFMAKVDLSTMSIEWEIGMQGGSPVIINDVVYAYLRPAARPSGEEALVWDAEGNEFRGDAGYYALALSDGHVIWSNVNDSYTKSGMVYCDGCLYCADFGTTYEWPVGGALRCIDPDSGVQLWAVRLDPGTGNAYNMCAPTIIDGKVYVGNDDGTIYCVSETPGEKKSETENINYISAGLAHWSWISLFGVMAASAVIGVILYRR